jgi:putative ABC transport system permease protein
LIISCFGLFGIASFTTARRSKEIGIRKALGASFRNIIFLVWRDYVKLIALSFIFAVPVVNYFLTDWLQEFAYRIELSWWLYLIPGVVILLIALLTISGQSIKAASLNPADSIRDE